MLRHCGVFLGADAGDINERKFHESEGLRKVNQFWLDQLIQFPFAPKGLHQFQKIEKLISSQSQHLINSVDIESLMNDFFRGEDRVAESAKIWGWKDPRNSATAAIWKQVFPGAIVVVMQREWNDRFREHPSKSEAGIWYRQESTEEVRNCYDHPVLVPEKEILRVDFDRLLVDQNEINKLLTELGMTKHLINDFAEFQSLVGVEKNA